jgi:tetratricopeptide (TPR) repeat protein
MKVWKVPVRNPNFTGRTRDLAHLDNLLVRNKTVTIQAIRGMGGVGKTQLAIEHCHRHAEQYKLVWWISSENPAMIPGQLQLLGAALDLELPSDAGDAALLLLSDLHQRRDWLLVFDNAESVDNVRDYLPSGPGHVLVTTRHSGFDALGSVLDLSTLDRGESIAVLRQRAPDVSAEQADELAALLGDLPLGLEQAAAYLKQTLIPVDEYLVQLRRNPDAMADKGRDGHRSSLEASLATLWTLSLTRLDELHPDAAQLLAVCAYLAPEAIPLDLFAANAEQLPVPLRQVANDPGSLSHTIGALVDYSLAQRTADHLVLHRLVQLAVRKHIATAARRTATHQRHPMYIAVELLQADLPGDVVRSPKSWPRWRQLMPHVLSIINHDHHLGFAAYESAPDLYDHAGTYLWAVGQFSDAQPILERALRIDEAAHGPHHLTLSTRLNNLAVVLRDLGRPAEARPLLERALRIDEATQGADDRAVATRLNNLAVILRDLGKPAEARPLLERALHIDEATYGPDHPAVATRLNNLAVVLRQLGETAEAQPLLERALRIGNDRGGSQ